MVIYHKSSLIQVIVQIINLSYFAVFFFSKKWNDESPLPTTIDAGKETNFLIDVTTVLY